MQAGNHCPYSRFEWYAFTILRLKSQTLDRHIDHENDWPVETGRNYNLIWWKIKNGYRCSLLTGTHMHPETVCACVCACCICVREKEKERAVKMLSGRLAPHWEQIGFYKLENEEQVCEQGNTLPYTSISSAHNFCDHRNSASGKTEEFNNAFY